MGNVTSSLLSITCLILIWKAINTILQRTKWYWLENWIWDFYLQRTFIKVVSFNVGQGRHFNPTLCPQIVSPLFGLSCKLLKIIFCTWMVKCIKCNTINIDAKSRYLQEVSYKFCLLINCCSRLCLLRKQKPSLPNNKLVCNKWHFKAKIPLFMCDCPC